MSKIKGTQTPEVFEFPTDIVPDNKAEYEIWLEKYAKAVRSYGMFSCFREKDNENFKYAQGKVPVGNFDHITKLYTNPSNKRFNRVLPAKIRQINPIAHLINRIIGKVDAEDINFTASVVNEDAVTAKLEEITVKAAEKLTRLARQQSDIGAILGRPVQEDDEIETIVPEDVENMSLSTYQQENEININRGLQYLLKKKHPNLKFAFSHQGLYWYVITGKMAFDTRIELGDPVADAIDPRFLIYDRENNSPFIENGRFNGYYFPGTVQDILDRCPELTEAQVYKLNEWTRMFGKGELAGKSSGAWYIDDDINMLFLNCYKIYWKAVKRTRVKISPNKLDEDNPHIHFVDENEKANESKGERIEDRYITTNYEATILGDIVYQAREIPNQFIPNDSPSERELPIVGIVDENPCILDLAKPLLDLRIQCFYSIERMIGQAKGKVLIVDEAIEENGQDNLYNMMAFGVYKVNTAKEGEMQMYNGNSGFLAPKEVDMGLSTAVNDLMRVVAFIDQNLFMMTGMNEPFQGVVKSDQGLGVTQAAIEQSQLTLQPYYTVYYTVIQNVMQNLCNLMRPAWGGSKKTANFLGDRGFEFFALDPETNWHLDQYGIFVENSVRNNQKMEFMVRMASQLLPIAKDPNLALSVIKMFNAKSAAQAEEIFEKGVKAMEKMRMAEQQFAQQQQQMASEIAAAGLQQKAAGEAAKIDGRITETKIEQAGETQRTAMTLEHDANKQTVDYKNLMNTKIADKLLGKEIIE